MLFVVEQRVHYEIHLVIQQHVALRVEKMDTIKAK